jgi:LuxR family maltose regulon positive regulatory protein
VTWLTLDERDNDPHRFGVYLIAALNRLDLLSGSSVQAWFSASRQPLESLVTALINRIIEVTGQPGSPLHSGFVLVFDDYHLITEPEILNSLGLLVAHLPPQMHLVLASRADPPLPLAQLRARGQLMELRANDLRFRSAEVSQFLNQKMGLDLSADGIASLEARTEGWAAGLQLAALSMRDRSDLPGFIQAFSGNHRYIVDYLARQVLSQQPAAVQASCWRFYPGPG